MIMPYSLSDEERLSIKNFLQHNRGGTRRMHEICDAAIEQYLLSCKASTVSIKGKTRCNTTRTLRHYLYTYFGRVCDYPLSHKIHSLWRIVSLKENCSEGAARERIRGYFVKHTVSNLRVNEHMHAIIALATEALYHEALLASSEGGLHNEK